MFQTIIQSITRLIQAVKARFTKPEDRIDTYAVTYAVTRADARLKAYFDTVQEGRKKAETEKVKVNSSITRPSLYRKQKKTKRQMQQVSRRINR